MPSAGPPNDPSPGQTGNSAGGGETPNAAEMPGNRMPSGDGGGGDGDDDGDGGSSGSSHSRSSEGSGSLTQNTALSLAKATKKFNSSNKTKRKLPDEIQVGCLFSASSYATWWSRTASTLKRASGRRDDKVVEWLHECKTKSLDELKNSGKRFADLDILLADALQCASKQVRVLGIRIHQYVVNEQNKNARVPKGRELMWFINNHYKSSVNAEQLYSYKDLELVVLVKTTPDEEITFDIFEDFVARWEYTLAGLEYDIPRKMIASLFYDQVRKYGEMRETWYHWENMLTHDPEKTYEWLAKRVDDHITDRRSKRNRLEISRNIAKLNKIENYTTVDGQLMQKAPGWLSLDRQATAVPGIESSPTGLGGEGNGSRNAKNRTPTPTPKGSKQAKSLLCNYFQLGVCKFGDHCQFSHETPPVGAEQRGDNKTQSAETPGGSKEQSASSESAKKKKAKKDKKVVEGDDSQKTQATPTVAVCLPASTPAAPCVRSGMSPKIIIGNGGNTINPMTSTQCRSARDADAELPRADADKSSSNQKGLERVSSKVSKDTCAPLELREFISSSRCFSRNGANVDAAASLTHCYRTAAAPAENTGKPESILETGNPAKCGKSTSGNRGKSVSGNRYTDKNRTVKERDEAETMGNHQIPCLRLADAASEMSEPSSVNVRSNKYSEVTNSQGGQTINSTKRCSVGLNNDCQGGPKAGRSSRNRAKALPSRSHRASALPAPQDSKRTIEEGVWTGVMDGALALGYTAPFKACNNELGGCSLNSCHSETSAHNTAKAGTNSQITPNDGPVNNNDNMAKASNNYPSTENQERIFP